MDVFAHTVWAALGARALNRKRQQKIVSVTWTAFWGVFPDIFAFGFLFMQMFFSILSGDRAPFDFPHGKGAPFLSVAHELYNYSHSLVIWLVVFLVVWKLAKRPRFELLGWLLHILIDMPTHTEAFFPTPFLFPVSEYHFPFGVSWGTPWFMIVNYLAMLVCGLYVFLKNTHAGSRNHQKS